MTRAMNLTRAQARAVAHYTQRFGACTLLMSPNGVLTIDCEGLKPCIVPPSAIDWSYVHGATFEARP